MISLGFGVFFVGFFVCLLFTQRSLFQTEVSVEGKIE